MSRISTSLNELEEEYPDILEMVLSYIENTLKNYDYTNNSIKNLISSKYYDKEEYSFSNSSFSNISEVKSKYVQDNDVTPEDKNNFYNNTKVQNILSDIEKSLLKELDGQENKEAKDNMKKHLNALKNNETNSGHQTDLMNIVQQELDLIGVYEETTNKTPKKIVYKYDKKERTYQLFNVWDLEKYLVEEKGFKDTRLLPITYSHLLERVNNIKTDTPELIELSNCYINIKTFEIIEKNDENKYFTTKRITFKNNGKLLEYKPSIDMDNIGSNISDTVQIFKEITVPKGNNTSNLMKFMLQVIGMCLTTNNEAKILPIFVDTTNKGKSTLISMLYQMFHDGTISIDSNSLNDNFITATLTNVDYLIVNDEFKFKDFDKYSSEYKKLSGGGVWTGRKLYSSEQDVITDIAPTILFTNEKPRVNIEDMALIERIIFLKLPNTFKNVFREDELKSNEYMIKKDIDYKLGTDFNGSSDLISMAINEFKKMDKSKGIKSQLAIQQTTNEKLSMIYDEDPLTLFVHTRLKPMPDNAKWYNYTKNTVIVDSYKSWYQRNYGENIPDVDNVKMGRKIKEIYPDVRKTTNDGTGYALSILTDKDISTYHKRVIEIRDYKYSGLTLENMILNHLRNDKRCINDVINVMPDTNKNDIIDTINNLDERGIINITENLTVN